MNKWFSARFLLTVWFGFIYGFIVLVSTGAYLWIMRQSPDKIEGFCVGLIIGFAGTATMIIKSYFDRTDRQPQGDNTSEEITTTTTTTASSEKPEDKTEVKSL